MKKVITLMLAAGLVFSCAQAHASGVNISGVWDFNFEGSDASFVKHDGADRFKARQRFRTQIDFVASESLKGVLFFEIGNTTWGNGGGQIGTDGKDVEVRYSYVDWALPNTEVRVRMGLQPFALPNFVAGDPILDVDGAGITTSVQFSDNAGLTAFWMRALNNNDTSIDNGQSDIADFFGVTVPLTGEGWQFTPWGMYANIGKNSLDAGNSGDLINGLLPAGVASLAAGKHGSNPAWWLGFGGELTAFDPFRFAVDFAYGSVDAGHLANGTDLVRAGWMASSLAEYKMDSVTPGLLFWYASGDNASSTDGSERMPTIAPSWVGSSFAWDGGFGISDTAVLSVTPTGTWGVIARLSDISFMENLSHVLSVGYYTGTNNKAMVRNGIVSAIESGNVYLTKGDHALEVNFDSQYKIYENLTLAAELGYIRLDLDHSVWADRSSINQNAYKVGLNLAYTF